MVLRIITQLLFIFLSSSVFAQIAVKADTVFTMAGEPLVNGVVLIKNGKIENVGANLAVPQGYTTYSAKVVTPGFIDARSMVGLSGAYNIPSDQDQVERSSPIQPELRAIDAYNPEDKLVSYVRDNGVTTLHTGHGWGGINKRANHCCKNKKRIN